MSRLRHARILQARLPEAFINHLALFLLIPAAVLAWRWSRLVSAALWFTFAVWLAYRGIRWQWPEIWAAGHLEWMRGVSAVTGLAGAVELKRSRPSPWLRWEFYKRAGFRVGHTRFMRVDALSAMLLASMGADLTALLIHRGYGQWGPQPFFQVVVLLAMCAIAWPRRT